MASHKDDVTTDYRNFFETFAATVNVNDPLPVKVGSHSIRDNEINGEIVDWTLQYLQQKNCPSRLLAHLASTILQQVKSLVVSDGANKDIGDDKGLEPVKLMQLVTSKINHVCLEYLDNQKFENLCSELLVNSKALHPVSVHAIRNGRRKMEDRHVVLQDLNTICSIQDTTPTSYYAVFDGHAGTDAAFYAASQLHEYLVQNPNFTVNPGLALKEAFSETDKAFISKHEHERLKGGTTAVVGLIRGNSLFVAWLGDSQAVLVREGVAIPLVSPHKPDRPDEKLRISTMGGEVIYWDGAYRVNGQLAVSRAIGDTNYKPYVTADPDVSTVLFEGTEDFLILACDGLWDTVSYEEAAFLVLQTLHRENDITEVSAHLVQAAKVKGSLDNITVIVVFLRDPALIARRPLPPVPEPSPSPMQATPTMEQQRKEFEELASKWGWNEPQGGAVFNELPWQQDTQMTSQDSANGSASPGEKASGMTFQASDLEWRQSIEMESELHNGVGFNPTCTTSGSGYHLSSDGSTWDQTSNSNPPGVDWNQYDEEISGQPSTIYWGSQGQTSEGGDSEQVISPIEDLGEQQQSYSTEFSERAAIDNQMWASDENSVKFPPLDTNEKDFQNNFTSDDTDFACPLMSNPVTDDWHPEAKEPEQEIEFSPDQENIEDVKSSHEPEQPSLLDDVSTEPIANSYSLTETEAVGHTNFQWNLSAPEFEFRPKTTEDEQHNIERTEPEEVVVPADLSLEEEVKEFQSDTIVAEDSTAFDAVQLGSDPSELPVQKADISPKENLFVTGFESSENVESMPGPTQLAVDLICVPPIEIEGSVPVEEPVTERKLSATELLIKSTNDAELAVLLAAANEDSDELEPSDQPEPLEEGISPRLENVEDDQKQTLLNDSKGEPVIEAEDSEDDWTFYRGEEKDPEDSVVDNDATNANLSVEVETENKLNEICTIDKCQASELASPMQRLQLVEDTPSLPAVNPVVEDEEQPTVHESQPVIEPEQIIASEPIMPIADADMVQLPECPLSPSRDETISIHDQPTIADEINANVISSTIEILETSTESHVTKEVPEAPSPVSDTGATVGSETLTLAAVGVTAAAAAGVAAAGKTVAKKGPTTPTKKAPSPSKAKPAVTTVKDTAKKTETVAKRTPTDAKASAETKPARPTKLSPLRKATPAVNKPTGAPRSTSAPKPGVTSTTTVVKKTTPVTTSVKVSTTTTTKKMTSTSAVESSGTVATTKPSPAKPLVTTTTTTTRTAAATATRKAAPVSGSVTTKTTTLTSRTTTATSKPAVNGDVKPKPQTSAPRPGTTRPTSTSSSAARPPVAKTATPAAKSTTALKTTIAKASSPTKVTTVTSTTKTVHVAAATRTAKPKVGTTSTTAPAAKVTSKQ